jgi:phosphoglycolate phosphatase-like HAD superfamily hydrolase
VSAPDRPLAIVDIDGVLADVRHRLHHLQRRPKHWRAFFAAARDDEAHPEGLAIVERLQADHEVVLLTGRPRELEADTRAWLEAHGLGGLRLVMRPVSDRRPAAQVKVEQLRELALGRTVAVVVDDDPDVIAAMAEAGHPTFLADWEPRGRADEDALHRAQEDEGRT